MRVGVLAVQGGFEAHERAITRLGEASVEVRSVADLATVDGLILPGGESTTISKGIEKYGLQSPIQEFVRSGGAVFGTCAGLIVLDRNHLDLIDIVAVRNAFGRQIASFECDVAIEGLGDEPVRAVFIRAPKIDGVGEGVEVLARHEGTPVVARQENALVCAFHPELTEDMRLHAYFLAMVGSKTRAVEA